MAIALVSGAEGPNLKTTRKKVSNHEASVLSKAHTQRAWLLWKLAKSDSQKVLSAPRSVDGLPEEKHRVAGESSSEQNQLPDQLRGLSREAIEEMASRDFAIGGRYGDESARTCKDKSLREDVR
jgi:hypothetical protein